jgi:hypothetical protein
VPLALICYFAESIHLVVTAVPRLKSRKREAFAQEIASLMPLASAYVAAGYKDTQWARFNASRLQNVPEVAARIAELQEQFAERCGIHAEYIQRQLLPLVEANPKDLFEPFYDNNGKKAGDRLKAVSDLPRSLSAAISKVKVDRENGAVTEIVLANKTEAANVLLRSLPGGQDEGAKAAASAVVEVRWKESQDDFPVVAQAVTQAQAQIGHEPVRGDAVRRLKEIVERMQ